MQCLLQYRNGLKPSYVIREEDIARISEAMRESQEKYQEHLKRLVVVARSSPNRKPGTREHMASICSRGGKVGGKVTARKLQRKALAGEEKDYFGNVLCFSIRAMPVDDPELHVEGGPVTESFQFVRFNPEAPTEDTSDPAAWKRTKSQEWLSLDTMTKKQRKAFGLI